MPKNGGTSLLPPSAVLEYFLKLVLTFLRSSIAFSSSFVDSFFSNKFGKVNECDFGYWEQKSYYRSFTRRINHIHSYQSDDCKLPVWFFVKGIDAFVIDLFFYGTWNFKINILCSFLNYRKPLKATCYVYCLHIYYRHLINPFKIVFHIKLCHLCKKEIKFRTSQIL